VLLEREAYLEVLAGPPGRLVLVGGEAGVGKTALVREFVTGRRVLWGTCDPLQTPRPLGPLRDVAAARWLALGSPYEARSRPATSTHSVGSALGRRSCACAAAARARPRRRTRPASRHAP
jgi:predicted ATPase